MKEILLKTEKLSKSFSNGGFMQHVLKNIDLQLYKGDFTVIMGASGAGKSTLLYALSGMDTPTLGMITFGNKVISDLSQDGLAVFRREHCGFVFQQIYLIDGMSVMDNVLSAGLLVSRDKRALIRRAKELFAAVDIGEETQLKFPAQISGGEAQRVGIVRALINSPEILFADEPTGALNSKTGLDVLDTLTKFNEQGQSVVMVTHDMRSARRGNRILYLKDGVILGECDLGRYSHKDAGRHEKLSEFLQRMGW
ncbi:ABC transporter ATP-binding protein [Parablautia muri]|uniref:ABC transporter ATP-binding protein n=1 Tax=Parablautia muri TaxID=2320879 RepID=A0A9X5GTU8_9FIRM|nr:ABC transporter ATP-binding protein [Parablautia muri]NBJ94165.1 ABC transporter ATP-binding protein [Parablautia muri]